MNGEVEVVIIEDNENDAELIQRVFKKHNLANKSIHLKDGGEALDFFAALKADQTTVPKVVLLDLKLPKVDGIEVLRWIRSDERMKETPVVILTSSNEERDIKEAYQLGVNSYVTKPIRFDEFAKVIADLGLYWVMLNKGPA